MLQQGGDQQAPDAAIAIQEGVDGFELGMHQGHLDQRRQGGVFCVNESLHVGQQAGHMLGWRRHEGRIARARAADPVLRTAQLAGLLARTAHAIEQQAVRVAQQAHADGQAIGGAQMALYLAEGAQVVGDLFDVIGVADGQPGLVIEQVHQRGLGAFDLRGQQGFLADGAVEQPVHRRCQPRDAGQASQGQLSRVVERAEGVGRQGWVMWRERVRHEGPDGLAQGRGDGVGACAAHGVKACLNVSSSN